MTQTLITARPGPGSEGRPLPDSPRDPRRARFEAIFAGCHDPVLRYLVRRTEDREDAADLLAEIFLVTWRRLDDIPADHALPWLYGVARRVLANHRRGELRRDNLADRLRADLSLAPTAAEPPAELVHVTAAVRQLSDADREVLTLVAWEGLDTAELATSLGCTANAASVRLYRARRRLERLLDRSPEPARGRGDHS